MSNIKFKVVGIILFMLFVLTGCTGANNDDEVYDFIKSCNSTPGCKYKVLKDECVCDKGHDYIPRR